MAKSLEERTRILEDVKEIRAFHDLSTVKAETRTEFRKERR